MKVLIILEQCGMINSNTVAKAYIIDSIYNQINILIALNLKN